MRLFGRSHDYVYYPNSWTNAEGRTFEAGYYDEDGNRYRNVVVENEETVLTCEYCGSQTKVVWKEGLAPNCENCGAPLQIDVREKAQETASSYSGSETGRSGGGLKVILLAIVIILAAMFFISFVSGVIRDREEEFVAVDQISDSIYVEEIGRTCYLDGEDYYDPETECWFWFNEEYGVWQYWYEGISSNYGDYGWMEYAYDEDQWYIQAGEQEWVPLPDQLKADYLWHFKTP